MDLVKLLTWERAAYLLTFLFVAQSMLVLNGLRSIYLPAIQGLSGDTQRHHAEDSGTFLSQGLPDTLSPARCDAAFPNLYFEVDRATSYWKEKKHTISKEDIDISWQPTEWYSGGAMRVLIHDNRIRILESINAMRLPGYIERGLGILNLLHRALESATAGGERLPTIEAAIVLQDLSYPPTEDGTESFWTWTRELNNAKYERVWIIPNFDFWAADPMGSYADSRLQAFAHDEVEKIPKAVWRGSRKNNEELRSGLVNTTRGKDWADVLYYDGSTRNATYPGENAMSLGDMCNYSMAIHTEGVTYSGRLKFLLNCNTAPVVHNLRYTSQYYHLLEKEGPNQNFIPVARDWSDLEKQVKYYLENPDKAQRIINNHMATFRNKYLTRAATSCYLRRLIQAYSDVSFKPETYAVNENGESGLRGRPFEVFMNKPEDFLEIRR